MHLSQTEWLFPTENPSIQSHGPWTGCTAVHLPIITFRERVTSGEFGNTEEAICEGWASREGDGGEDPVLSEDGKGQSQRQIKENMLASLGRGGRDEAGKNRKKYEVGWLHEATLTALGMRFHRPYIHIMYICVLHIFIRVVILSVFIVCSGVWKDARSGSQRIVTKLRPSLFVVFGWPGWSDILTLTSSNGK